MLAPADLIDLIEDTYEVGDTQCSALIEFDKYINTIEELKAEMDALSLQCDELIQENNELNEEVDRLTIECEGLVEDNEMLREDIHNNTTAAKRLDLIRDIL